MTAIVASTSPSGAAALAHDVPQDAAAPDPSARADTSHDGAEHPLAKFALNDLHQAVQLLATFTPDAGHGADTLFAPHTTRADSPPGAGIPLYGGQQPGAVQGQQLPATPPVKPGPPIDLQQMEALNRAVQRFNVAGSPMDHGRLKYTQAVFKAATEALKNGDYKEAQQQFAKLGLPLPPMSDKAQLTEQQQATAHVLGVGAQADGNGWKLDSVRWGARGHQGLNDLSGYAANTAMINRLASLPGGVSNPPTEAQLTAYMRDCANPAKGKPASAQQIMQAASDITRGTIMHYSAVARTSDPVYDKNPNPRAFYKGTDGQLHEFASAAEAKKAADAGTPPKAHHAKIMLIESRSPDQWSDITSQGQRAGRYIGDCESKVFLQTRLLTEAGFTSLGSVDVQHKDHSGPGHMFGVFKAPDGTIWVTSNEEFKQVRPSDAKKGVTQADLDATVREFTGEVYHIQPNYKGEIDTSDFSFGAASTAKLNGPNAAIDSIRRSTELGVLGRSDTLLP